MQVWRPAVVAAHHRAVLEQTPVDTAAEEHQLNQRIAESRLTVCVLSEPAWCLDGCCFLPGRWIHVGMT